MKFAIVLAVLVATASALSPADFKLFKSQVRKTKMQAVQAMGQMHDHRVLMSNVSQAEEDMCKEFEKYSTLSKCADGFVAETEGAIDKETATEMCRCFIMPMMSQFKPLLDLQCGGGRCAAVFEAMATEDDGEVDFAEICDKRDCINQLFTTMRALDKPPATPANCPEMPSDDSGSESASSDDGEMEEGIAAMTDGMNFYCAKNVKGEYCGNAFEAVGKKVDSECGNSFNDTCACRAISSGGCCLKSAYDFLKQHEPSGATEFKTGFDACGYDLNKMATCASNEKKVMRYAKQELSFTGVKCGKTKDEVGYIVQQKVAEKAAVDLGNVAVIVNSCPCCSDSSAGRRLLQETGKVDTTVSITGDDVDTAASNLNKAVSDGSLTQSMSTTDVGGSVDKTATTEAKVATQESDIPTGETGSGSSFSPSSILVAVLVAVVATIF